jgi:putative peptidoglycan binding protein
MATRILLAPGTLGELVKCIQRALVQNGCALHADGVYGEGTCEALRSFQSKNSLTVSGTVEEATWTALMRRPVPPVAERCLYLTSALEGHGFELAVGNFDGAMLTWGIVGFTMRSGHVQKIVQAIDNTRPELVHRAFGAQRDELLQLMSSASEFQKNWATAHTLKNGLLAEPWRSMFAQFGAVPEVQTEQLRQAHADYLEPAIRTARQLRFTSELGLALSFDIHVQNGGLRPQVWSSIQRQVCDGMPELERRRIVANSVAAAAGKWCEDVRARKLTIANGEGTVHGHHCVLENWGLSGDVAAPELALAAHA